MHGGGVNGDNRGLVPRQAGSIPVPSTTIGIFKNKEKGTTRFLSFGGDWTIPVGSTTSHYYIVGNTARITTLRLTHWVYDCKENRIHDIITRCFISIFLEKSSKLKEARSAS